MGLVDDCRTRLADNFVLGIRASRATDCSDYHPLLDQWNSSSPAVAVVNQAFVKKFFKPGENPLGHRFGSPGTQSSGDFEIVGVVEDTAYNSATRKNHAMYFIPMTQRIPESARRRPIEQDTGLYAGAIVIQTDRPMDNMQSIARQILAAINPNLSVVKFQSFDEQIADRFTQDRMITRFEENVKLTTRRRNQASTDSRSVYQFSALLVPHN